jgi:hypothetical protein
LSVIITSCNAADLLDRCVAAIVPQPEAQEIIVADCSIDDPTPRMRARYPQVRIHRMPMTSVPVLRWTAARQARGDVIGAIEARCIPASDWCAKIVAAHTAWRDAPAVGGPVALHADAASMDAGLYLCEYAAFAPPVREGPAAELSGANLSYKRADLERAADLLDAGVWEAAIHERWRRDRRSLAMSSALVTFHNGLAARDALAMRFHYARAYAAERVAGDIVRRVIYAVGTPILPALLTWRAARAARAKGLTRELRRGALWLLLFNLAWSAGEFAGYVFGAPSRPRAY